MALDDKIKNAADNIAGKAKESIGKATDNESLEAEGINDQTKAQVKKTGEDIKDTLR